jgi:hypothetical protein
MKFFYCAFIVIALMATPKMLFAQETVTAYSKGESNISAGYGFINIWETLLNYYGQKTVATGPFVLTYEYGVSKKISVGITGGYAKVTNNYTQQFTDYLVEARANYHLGNNQKFDPYLSAGFGYYWFKYSDNYGNIILFTIPSSLAISAAAGAKYYFYPRFGAYGEVGYIDGSIIKIGITFKTR